MPRARAEPAPICRTRSPPRRSSWRSGIPSSSSRATWSPWKGLTDSDPDDWQDVTHRKWGGKECTFPSVTSPKLSATIVPSTSLSTRNVPSTSLSTSSSTSTSRAAQCSVAAADTRAGQCPAARADARLLRGASTSPTGTTLERASVQLRSPARGKGQSGKLSNASSCREFMNHKCSRDDSSGKYFCTS